MPQFEKQANHTELKVSRGFRLPASQLDLIERIAREQGETWSVVVRQLLAEALALRAGQEPTRITDQLNHIEGQIETLMELWQEKESTDGK